jgi:hypothetical protein
MISVHFETLTVSKAWGFRGPGGLQWGQVTGLAPELGGTERVESPGKPLFSGLGKLVL